MYVLQIICIRSGHTQLCTQILLSNHLIPLNTLFKSWLIGFRLLIFLCLLGSGCRLVLLLNEEVDEVDNHWVHAISIDSLAEQLNLIAS